MYKKFVENEHQVCLITNVNKDHHATHLMFIRYWASATASGLPLMVIVRSVLPPSRSSQLEIRIMAPEIWRISAILVPPFPIMHPIKSFGTVISCCWVFAACVRFTVVRSCDPARAARAVVRVRNDEILFEFADNVLVTYLWDSSHLYLMVFQPVRVRRGQQVDSLIVQSSMNF